MESCGLSYMEVAAAPKYGAPRAGTWRSRDSRQINERRPNFESAASTYELDPALDELLAFGDGGETADRHLVRCAELRQLIMSEQRKYSISLLAKRQQEADKSKRGSAVSAVTADQMDVNSTCAADANVPAGEFIFVANGLCEPNLITASCDRRRRGWPLCLASNHARAAGEGPAEEAAEQRNELVF